MGILICSNCGSENVYHSGWITPNPKGVCRDCNFSGLLISVELNELEEVQKEIKKTFKKRDLSKTDFNKKKFNKHTLLLFFAIDIFLIILFVMYLIL